MKKNICLLLFSLFISSAQAYVLEAKPVEDLLNTIAKTKFTYKERGMIFGYATIQSCLYVSSEIVILKNYCYPSKNYPAKSYTVVSREHGIIDFYQEDLGAAIKRDVQITTFPDVLKDYFFTSLEKESIASVNVNFEKIYNSFGPACWSTNYDYNDGIPAADCNAGNVLKIDEWILETQAMTATESSWANVLSTIDTAITK